MSNFMTTFGAHAMDGIPDEEMPAIADAARGVVREILIAGVYVLAGGLGDRSSSVVGTDGTVTDGPEPDTIGAVTIVDVPTREQALEWAAKIAVACRCSQDVWEIGHDPELEAMITRAEGRG